MLGRFLLVLALVGMLHGNSLLFLYGLYSDNISSCLLNLRTSVQVIPRWAVSHSNINLDLTHLKALGRPEGPIPNNVRDMSHMHLPHNFILTITDCLGDLLGPGVRNSWRRYQRGSSKGNKLVERDEKIVSTRWPIWFNSDDFRSQIDDMDSRLGFASYVNRGTEIFGKRFTGPQ
jgi:hypothetical protein